MKISSLVGHVVELLEILSGSSLPADAIIGEYFRSRRYLGSHDRRFIAETFYGVLRHRRLCDHLIDRTEGVLAGITGEGRSILRVSTYLLAIVPSQEVRIADIMDLVDQGQNADRLRSALKGIRSDGLAGLEDLAPDIRWSFPEWMTARCVREFGAGRLEEVLEALNQPAPLSIRVNTLKTSVEACEERLVKEGIQTSRGVLAPTCLILHKRMNAFSLDSFREGWFEVQDEGSQVLIQLADPKPTDRILDMCAGAGGKTLGMASIMKNRGEIVATDVSSYRLKELRKRMRRAGAGNIRIREDILGVPGDGSFDRVLVDAPCTGVGTIRRNPGMKWTVTEDMVNELSAKQSAILEHAAGYVKQGGLLLYATCSLFREENEEVVERFLREQPGFALEPREVALQASAEGSKRMEGSLRLSPHEHNTDGFYCAFLRRMSAAQGISGQLPQVTQ